MTRLIMLSLLFFSVLKSSAQTGKLIVVVKGIQMAKGGELSTGVFIKENFPKVGKQVLVA